MGNLRRPQHGPEWHVQKDLMQFLRDRKWLVERTHGNLYQTGFPDLYCYHPTWNYRWIDVKQPNKYSFTKAQRLKWPLWESYGVGIWILIAATQDEYDKLFQPPNWRSYWKPGWGQIPSIDELLDELDREES
jgi:hypothetical protein